MAGDVLCQVTFCGVTFCRGSVSIGRGIVLPSLTPVGEIDSQIPANVYGGNRPSKTLC